MDEDIKFKEIPRERKKHRRKHYLMRFLIVFLIVIVAGGFLLSPLFDIAQFEVRGNAYYTPEEVVNISGAETGGNLFLHAQEDKIRENLLQDPYFTEVVVKRKVPNTLVIEVKERRQIAAIKYGDSFVVVSEDGTVLRKTDLDPLLTVLTGLTISKMKEGEKVKAVERRTLSKTLSMVSIMDEGDLYFKKIEMDGLYIRAYIYDTLIVKGKPEQMKEAIESGNLQKVVNKLMKEDKTRGTITLGEHNYISFSPAF